MKGEDQILGEARAVDEHARYLRLWLQTLGAVLVLSLVGNLMLIYTAFYVFPIKQFLWTSDAAAVCEATPLSEPNISQASLRDLAGTVAVGLNTYDYANWRRLIDSVIDRYFTPRGRSQYRAALSASGIISSVVNNYQTVSAVVSNSINIKQEGLDAGRYRWVVEVPVRIFYSTNAESKIENRLLTVTLVRVDPSPLNLRGVAVDGVVSSQLMIGQGQ